MDEIKQLLQTIGLPFAYDHFAEGNSPDPPFLIYLYPESHNFGADGIVYFPVDVVHLENVAYIMAIHADPSIPKTIEEWLDGFEMFSLYEVLPEILSLWGENMKTEVASKKGR